MSAGKVTEFVDDKGFEQLDKLLNKLGIVRQEMIDNISVAKQFNDAIGNTKTLSDFTAANNSASNALKNVADKQEVVTTLQQQANTATAALVESTKAKVLADADASKVLAQLSGGLSENIKLLVEQKIQLAEVNGKIKEHTKAMGDNSSTQVKNINTTVGLTQKQIELKLAIGETTKNINQQVKEAQSAEGSNNQLNASLLRLRTTYDSLSAAEKNAVGGQVLLKEIQALDVATKKGAESQGVFNKSVGDYEKATTKAVGATNFATKAFSQLRNLANLLPGIGISGIVLFAAEPILNYIKSLDVFKEKVTEAKLKQESLNQALAGTEYTKAVSSITQLTEDIKLAKEGFLVKTKVLNEYNKELGNSLGHTNSLDEAEQKIVKHGQSYIEITLLKAAGQIALGEASKKAYEAEQARLKTDVETANFGDKITAKNLFSSSEFDPDSQKDYEEGIKKNGAKRKAAAIKAAEDEKNQQLNVFKKLREQAAKIAKENNIDLFGGTEDDKKGGKDKPLDDKIANIEAYIKYQKAKAKEVLEDENQTYTARLQALQLFTDKSNELIDRQTNAKNSVKGISKTAIDTNNRNALTEKLGVADYFNSGKDKLDKEVINKQKQAAEELKKIIDEINQETTDDLKEALNQQLQDIAKNASDDIAFQTKKFTEKLIKEDEYNRNVKLIRDRANEDKLKAEIANEEAILNARERLLEGGMGNITPKDVQASKNRVAGLKVQLTDQQTQTSIDSSKGDNATAKDKGKDAIETIRVAQDVQATAENYLTGVYQAQLQILEQKKQAITEAANAEIQGVNNSILSNKEKQRQINLINAQAVQAQKQIQEQENKVKRQQAQADRALALANIVENTAVAAIKAPAELGPIFGLAAVPIVLALGAAQLAAVLATPLPQFEKGGTVKKDGHIITGEAGTELRIDPSGKTSFTADHANVSYAKAGTKIISNKELVQMLGKPETVQYVGGQAVDLRKLEKLTAENNELQKRQKRPVVNIYGDRWGNYSNQRNY